MLDGTPRQYTLAVWTTPNLGLHHFDDPAGGGFSERRPGLGHLAFDSADLDELHAWAAHLDAIGIDHGGILSEPYGSGLAFRDPDNIALEFFARAPRR